MKRAGPGRRLRVLGTRFLRSGWAAVAAWLAFVLLSAVSMSGESPTFDEPSHLAAGHSYLRRGDFRMNPEHPPLTKLAAALPLAMTDVRWPGNEAAWASGDLPAFAHALLYDSGNDPDRMLWLARIPTLLWAGLWIGSVYAATRRFFGRRAAAVSLLLTAFSPALLAHGHLVTSDVAIAGLVLPATLAFWDLTQDPRPLRAAACGLLLGLALAAKFTAALLIPAFVVLAILRVVLRGQAPPPRVSHAALAAFVMAGVAWLTLWSAYGFRFPASSDPVFAFRWDFPRTRDGVVVRSAELLKNLRLVPEAWAYGLAYVQENAQVRDAYALGAHSMMGWSWYFPFAFLVKTPTAVLALLGWGAFALARRRREIPRLLPLLIPAALLGLAALGSRLNIGERHLFPVYGFLWVVVAGLATSEFSGFRRLSLALALLGAAEAAAATPYPLSFFNLPARALAQRHELLVDSNLDWGQDLKRLRRWAEREGVGRMKLGYFGTASPAQLGLEHEALPAFHTYTRYERGWTTPMPFKPGDVVAVSATAFVGAYLDDRDFYRRTFGGQEPVARIGHSILVFRVPR